MKIIRAAIAALGLAVSSAAGAAIIDNGQYTTDTNLGLDYLDVGLINDTFATFQAGVLFGGRTWVLATTAQIASTWAAATGLPLTEANVRSSDNNMTTAAVNTLINLFDGVTTDVGDADERVIGDFSVANYWQFVSDGGLAVHDQFDDSHFVAIPQRIAGAWLVAPQAAVPEPGTLALLGLGLAGLAATRRRKQ